MSGWTHPICWACWIDRFERRQPVRTREPVPEVCCFCWQVTRSGIYVRWDPEILRCQGNHESQILHDYDSSKDFAGKPRKTPHPRYPEERW